MTKPHLIISSYDDRQNPWYGGGGAIAVHEVARRLTDRFDVTVVTGCYPGAQNIIEEGVRYERVGWCFFGPRLGQLLFHAIIMWHAFTRSYDVWLESFTPPWSTSFLPLLTRRPVVGIVHLLSGIEMRRKYHVPFDLLERFGLRFYDRIIVISQMTADQLKAINPRLRTILAGNGVEVPAQETLAEKDRRVIGFLGRFEVDQKGIDILLRAYARLPKSAPPLALAGSGSRKDEAKMRGLIEELGLEGRVEMPGRLSGAVKEAFLRSILIGVAPSRYETFSLAGLEFIAWGAPLIIFDIAGFCWLPKEACVRISPFDENALTEALKALLADPARRAALAAAGRAVATQYDWGRIAGVYRTVLDDAMGLGGQADILIKDIVAKKRPGLFFSPHLDDAALSAGGLLTLLSKKVPCVVATAFTKAGDGPNTLSAAQYLKQCGATSAATLYAARRAEDSSAWRSSGVAAVHLGYIDALWRRHRALWRRTLGKLVPEVAHQYPTYRFHIARGRVTADDRTLMKELAERFRALAAAHPGAIVFAPAAIGNHVDHVIVREACRRAFGDDNIVFWMDYPYSDRARHLPKFLRHHQRSVFADRSSEKRALIASYGTQVQAMFGSNVPAPADVYLVPEHFLS